MQCFPGPPLGNVTLPFRDHDARPKLVRLVSLTARPTHLIPTSHTT